MTKAGCGGFHAASRGSLRNTEAPVVELVVTFSPPEPNRRRPLNPSQRRGLKKFARSQAATMRLISRKCTDLWVRVLRLWQENLNGLMIKL